MGEMLLEWEGHDKALSTKLWEFFNEEYLVDFSVTCHGKQMKVHKFVLALMFPILKESLRSSGTFPFNQEGIAIGEPTLPMPEGLNLDNIVDHAEDMTYLIQFAYTGKATVPDEHADCLMRIADSMEIKSLKDSIGQWHDKLPNKTETETTPLTRLRPRTQLKKVADESVDFVCSDDNGDTDFNSIVDEDSRPCSIESFDDCSGDDDEDERINKARKKKTKQNKLPRKQQSDEDKSKEKSVPGQNTTTTSLKKTRTISKEEADDGTPSSDNHTKTNRPTDDTAKKNECHKCALCNYVATFPYRLRIHLESHAKKQAKGPKQFTCKICKKGFERRRLLETHRDSNCGRERPTCKYCGHTTNRKAVLLQHIMAKHKVDGDGNPLEKNVKCSKCDFVCYAKHQLRVHSLAKHDLIDKYKCKECSFTAPSRSRLLKHDRIRHQNRRDFMCEECGNRYQTSGALSRHVLVTHKGMKPHKCDICGAEYSSSSCYKLHRQSHDGNVDYKHVCHACGHRTKRRDALRIHMRKEHGLELANGNPQYEKLLASTNSELETPQTDTGDI